MPPSQLKRLKASLRENGITGPQKSKKAKKEQKRNGVDLRLQKQNALANLREEFNPFEVKAANRPRKFAVTTSRPIDSDVLGRPGVSKSAGEEARRNTLLPELYRRNKVGGVVDRRIGENDPTMTPEERMLQRFTREKAKKKGVVFDLEAEEDDEGGLLTHGGKALVFDQGRNGHDDFDKESVSEASSDEERPEMPWKRLRDEDEADEDEATLLEQPEKKKSKAEVMKEVIAKSKLHKYERQQAKEEDDDLREKLDNEMPDLLALIRGHARPKQDSAPTSTAQSNGDFFMNPDRAALLAGNDREDADREYDRRLRQMILDKRAKPTERTKTEEELAQEEAARLRKLEEKRQRRMRGEEESEDDEPTQDDNLVEDEQIDDQAAEFGLSNRQTLSQPASSRPEGVDDEDDFLLDDEFVATESDLSELDGDEYSEILDKEEELDEDFEFVQGQYGKDDGRSISSTSQLAFTYPCPQTHAEFVEITNSIADADVPTVIQRIRALYAPQLAAGNKEKLGLFAHVLIDHIAYLAIREPPAPLAVIETLIRHIHSLSRTYADTVATAFRSHLQTLHSTKNPSAGDLVILTAISSIYPTSDHFHQVVTPAITLMARWLGLMVPQSLRELSIGAYLVTLCLKCQALSKRYVPEAIRFTLSALKTPIATAEVQNTHVKNLLSMAELWTCKSAFTEIFSPAALSTLQSLPNQKYAVQRLRILLDTARHARRPLQLHHHRPLALKTCIPKFEDSFDPTKHYDPDKERSDAAKLRAEYKKERKGAMRELRKDANFIARQQLKDKKERDRAYEEKYRKLVASIQAEEGQGANEYEREKRARKGRRSRDG